MDSSGAELLEEETMFRLHIVGVCILLACGACGSESGGSGSGSAGDQTTDEWPPPSIELSPEDTVVMNATYVIDGQVIPLVNGQAEMEAAPGSASKMRTRVLKRPIPGDLDGDGMDDATVILVQDPGGSGTFAYMAAAIRSGEAARGTNAIMLGDRVHVQHVTVGNGLIAVRYLDRGPDDPMSTPPTRVLWRYAHIDGDQLTEVQVAEGDQAHGGWAVIGHEVRSFGPCARKESLWLLGTSPGLSEMTEAYQVALPDAEPYTPLFMVVSGHVTDAPSDGFGAEYPAGMRVNHLIHVWPTGKCAGDWKPVTPGSDRP